MPEKQAADYILYGTVPGEEEAQKLFSIFEDKLMSILHLYADPKPGVTEAVELLREKGIKILRMCLKPFLRKKEKNSAVERKKNSWLRERTGYTVH